jgi:hypothetical protein
VCFLVRDRESMNKSSNSYICIFYSDRAIPPSIAPIKALGKFYHPGHIKCYHCYEPIDDRTGWKEHQGRVYCKKDFKQLFLPKCRACNKTVEKEAVSAMDGKLRGKWHLDCFGCHVSCWSICSYR